MAVEQNTVSPCPGPDIALVAMNKRQAENYIILPACMLMLNVFNQVVGHLAKGLLVSPWIEAFVVMVLVLIGSTLTAYLVVPWLAGALRLIFKQSSKSAGELGQLFCAVLYFTTCYALHVVLVTRGPAALIP